MNNNYKGSPLTSSQPDTDEATLQKEWSPLEQEYVNKFAKFTIIHAQIKLYPPGHLFDVMYGLLPIKNDDEELGMFHYFIPKSAQDLLAKIPEDELSIVRLNIENESIVLEASESGYDLQIRGIELSRATNQEQYYPKAVAVWHDDGRCDLSIQRLRIGCPEQEVIDLLQAQRHLFQNLPHRPIRTRGKPRGTGILHGITEEQIKSRYRELRTELGRRPTQVELAYSFPNDGVSVDTLSRHMTNNLNMTWPPE